MESEIYGSTVEKLEIAYGVHITEAALTLAAQIAEAHGEDYALLKGMDAIQLIERACQRLRSDLDSDNEESVLDWDEYCLDRAFVEVTEFRREKSLRCQAFYLPRIEKEFSEFTSKWEVFMNKWVPVLTQLRLESEKRVVFLRHLRQMMVTLLEIHKFQGHANVDYFQLLQPISTATTQLLDTVHSAFREILSVGPSVVAQVASSLTGLPITFFDLPFKLTLPLDDLESRLSDKFIGLENVIHIITDGLSKQRSSRGPFGSFLLLGSHGSGRTTLAKALAEDIFGDKERFIKLDMSEYKEPDVRSCLIDVLDSEKKHGSVVMFENIENAHDSTTEILCQILRDGRMVDGQGLCVDFTHDLVLISSHFGHEVLGFCKCLRDKIQKLPFKDLLFKKPDLLHADLGKRDKCCSLRPFLSKVTDQLKPELIELVDDVVVFPYLNLEQRMAISRLQIRDIATSMSESLKKQIILYPSCAATSHIIFMGNISERGARAYETWLQEYMEPQLYANVDKNKADEMIIIYIDLLLGLRREFSFRAESSIHLANHEFHKNFKENLRKLRTAYRREKLQVNKIYRLVKSHFHLFEAEFDAACVPVEVEEVVRLIDDLLSNEPSYSNDLEAPNLNRELEYLPENRISPRSQISLKRVRQRMRSSLSERDKATQVVTKALLRHLKGSYRQPTSFLCLGLTPFAEEQFAKGLKEHLLIGDDGKTLLIQVDLSQCTEPESFFRCTCSEDPDLSLADAVKRTPHSVIVFYRLEMAHISVFSAILSILDYGVSMDSDGGNMINYGNSVVVIVSDIGNKDLIARLNGHHSKAFSRPHKPVALEDEEGLSGLRSELMTRLDDLLLFDPLSDDQLNRFYKLPMKTLEETNNFSWSTFYYLCLITGYQSRTYNPNFLGSDISEARSRVMKKR